MLNFLFYCFSIYIILYHRGKVERRIKIETSIYSPVAEESIPHIAGRFCGFYSLQHHYPFFAHLFNATGT